MASPTAPIVLIHGLWLPPHSWRGWIDRYTAAGYTVHAPAWPGVSDVDEELDHAKSPPGDIGIEAVADQFATFVRALPEPPILIGHSMGGLITQLLLDRGLGRAGIAIQPSKPRGVLRWPLSVMRSTWPVVRNPANAATCGADHANATSTTSSPTPCRAGIPTRGTPSWPSRRRGGRSSRSPWPT